MKVTVANKTWSIGKEYFVPAEETNNQYYVFVDGLNAGQMCEPI